MSRLPSDGPRRYPDLLINHTRYYTGDLRVFLHEHLHSTFKGIVVFKHYTPTPDAEFIHHPELVKMNRNRTEVEGKKDKNGFKYTENRMYVGLIKPTHTAFIHPSIPELESLAVVAGMAAPLMLRRQLVWRLRKGAAEFGKTRTQLEKYLYGPSRYDYKNNPDWFPELPPLRFHKRDRSSDNIAWQEKMCLAEMHHSEAQAALSDVRKRGQHLQRDLDRMKEKQAALHQEAERAIIKATKAEQEFAFLQSLRPLD